MAIDGTRVGYFLPTTNIFDTTLLLEKDINSSEFREFFIRITQGINNLNLAVNAKDTGYYLLNEFVTGQTYFQDQTIPNNNPLLQRPVYRLVINFGALPNTATKSVAHNLTPATSWSMVKLYGSASDQTAMTYIPLPYASIVLANNIELNVDATNVNVTTAADYSSYTVTYIILEYLKN